MFEPENDIERMLVRARTEAAARPAFLRALMDTQVFQVLVADCGPLAPGPDGKITIPAGAKLTMPSATHGEQKLIPFFTAPSRARIWFTGDHLVAPDKTRDLFGRFPDEPFMLNPGSDCGKEFTPHEVKRLLDGHFEEGPQTQIIQKPEQVLLAHPKETPTDLIAALAGELGALKSVRAAFLMLAMRAGQSEQSWMLGVDHDGSWQDVRAAIGRALASDVLRGRMLDAMALDDSSISSTLRTGMPITAAKRGLFQKLFR